jgi:hypothetical protein
MTTARTAAARTNVRTNVRLAARRASSAALRSASGACIQPRVFETFGQIRGKAPEGIPLSWIRDRVEQQTRLQDPRDIERTPSQLRLEWDPQINRATLQILGGSPGWMADDRMLHDSSAFGGLASNGTPNAAPYAATDHLVFTRHGLRAYVREVFGGHAMGLLDRMVGASAKGGAAVSTMAAALLARPLDERVLRLRTVRTRDPVSGGVVRAVRGVFRGYTPYDDLQFLTDLLECPDTRDLPVLDYRRADDGLRVRFSFDPLGQLAREPNAPSGIVDALNSETGGGRPAATVLQGGIFKLICLNGMMGYAPGATWRWNHSGNVERVRNGVPQAVAELRNAATGLVNRYNQAVDVQIDNAFAWLQSALVDEAVNDETVEAFGAALDHETTTPGRMLASTIDAMTWVAHEQADMFRQREIEMIAARVMDRGLDEASRPGFAGSLRAPIAA